jgi:hypothetical protein
MTQEFENDMALNALLKAATEIEPDLSQDLLLKSYAIQRKHQFDREDSRETSMQDLKVLLDTLVDSTGSTPS